MSTSLPAPPNRLARGSAPLASLRVIVSLPPRPKTWISEVLATVGVPPTTATAPPLTRILPAASRLIVIVLSRASPVTVSVPALNVAVVAAFAGALVAASRPAASAVPANNRRALSRVSFIVSLCLGWLGSTDASGVRRHRRRIYSGRSRASRASRYGRRMGGRLVVRAAIAVAVAAAACAPAQAAGYDDEAYLRFADHVAAQLEPAWSPADGYYLSGSPVLESRFNAAMLLVHATAARYGHAGPARNDDRARQLARVLTASPPFFTGAAAPWPDPMYHSPGWVGNLVPGYSAMDKAIDPKVAEGLFAAWQARDALGCSRTAAAIGSTRLGDRVAQVVLPLPERAAEPDQLAARDGAPTTRWRPAAGSCCATSTGCSCPLPAGRAAAVDRAGRPTTTNLSPSYRFHYVPGRSAARADQLRQRRVRQHHPALPGVLRRRAAGRDARRRPRRRPPPARVGAARAVRLLDAPGLLNWDTGLGRSAG